MLLHFATQLACKSVKRVDVCFSSSEGQANLHPVSDKTILKIYRITTVLKMNVLSNLSVQKCPYLVQNCP